MDRADWGMKQAPDPERPKMCRWCRIAKGRSEPLCPVCDGEACEECPNCSEGA